MSEGAKEEPVRMCMICRRRFAKSQLLRHVLAPAPEGGREMLQADMAQKRTGRGWYVCRAPECREKLTKAEPNIVGRARRKRKGK